MESKPRAVIYARVSTVGKGQDPALQVRPLREAAAARGWEVVRVVEELASGAKDKRPLRAELLKMARRREVDLILVWKLDRWSRSLLDLVHTLQEFRELGVGFYSHTEALDFTTAAGRAMAGLLGVFAELERDLIRERIIAGQANARAKGRRIGRPPVSEERVRLVLRLLAEGKPWRVVNDETGVGMEGIARILRGWQEQNGDRLPEAGREVAADAVKRILADWHKFRAPRASEASGEM